eukprot:scaffold362555_cov113-Cyclotella_meneghiniana.AAC.2
MYIPNAGRDTHLSLATPCLLARNIRWQNTEADIIQCTQCNSAICIAFHPKLNKASYDDLTQQYFNMLATSHESGCIFRKYVERWLKIMKRLDKPTDESQEVVASETGHPDLQYDLPKSQSTRVCVPPYFLSLSKQFLVFEDASKDGSVTFYNIQELASIITKEINSQYDVSIPDALRDYCEFPTSWKCTQTANLLATFGWHISQTSSSENDTCVQCTICLSRAILASRKRRFSQVKVNNDMDEVKLHLIHSHRVYCPYVGGFSFGTNHNSEPGWRVILKNLVKFANKEKGDNSIVRLDDLWAQENARKN